MMRTLKNGASEAQRKMKKKRERERRCLTACLRDIPTNSFLQSRLFIKTTFLLGHVHQQVEKLFRSLHRILRLFVSSVEASVH